MKVTSAAFRASAVFVVALALGGCASAPPRPPAAAADDLVYPTVRPGELTPDEAGEIEKAWQQLLEGSAAAADRRLVRVLARNPGLLAAETALGFVRLREGAVEDARLRFAAVLERRPGDFPALVGSGLAAARGGDTEAALTFFRRASATDPANEMARRRLGELRLSVTERRVSEARASLAAGATDAAVDQYRKVLEAAPEVAGVRLELAELLVSRGDVAEAMAVLEADPTSDRQTLLRLGELRVGRREYDAAFAAYRRILDQDPGDADALAHARAAREAFELEQMPEEYRRIANATALTRADLAALIMVKVTALARLARPPARVAIDVSGSWARDHIIRALAFEILSVYPNHTFQPGATVRRGDLARAVARVLDLLKYPSGPRPQLTDLGAGNVNHYAAGRVVAAGLMDLTPDGKFEAWRPVAGREAVDVVEGLARLVGA